MPAADPKKFVAGWIFIGAAVAAGIAGMVHDHTATVMFSLCCVIAGADFAKEGWKRKAVPPHLPGLRWHHIILVAAIIATAVFWLYRSIVH